MTREAFHGLFSAVVSRRMVPMMPAIWFHFSVSSASCLRPGGREAL